jgi:hypothetical protein
LAYIAFSTANVCSLYGVFVWRDMTARGDLYSHLNLILQRPVAAALGPGSPSSRSARSSPSPICSTTPPRPTSGGGGTRTRRSS